MGQPDSLFTYAIVLSCGLVWGLAFQLSHVSEFFFVLNQMNFSTFVMIKMFLAALTTSMISWLILSSINQSYRERIDRFKSVLTKGGFCDVGLYPLILGSCLLGVGMSLSASCPGTVFAQIGAGSTKAWYIVVGGLIGSLLWSLIELIPNWKQLMKSGQASWLTQTIDQTAKSDSRKVAITLIAMLMIANIGLEWAVPYQEDAAKLFTKQPSAWVYWPYTIAPWTAGVMLGAQQLIMFGLAGKTLGSSTSYAVLMSHILKHLPVGQLNQAERLRICRDPSQLWRLFLTAGVVLGSFIGTRLASEPYSYISDSLINKFTGMIGGVLMVFGSRLAEGCTSGHGITGCSLLTNRSWVATACIFGSAMLIHLFL